MSRILAAAQSREERRVIAWRILGPVAGACRKGVGQRQQGAQADGDAVQEIAPRDGLVHAKTVLQIAWC